MGAKVPTMTELLKVFNLKVDPYGCGKRKLWIEPLQVAVMLQRLCNIRGRLAVYASKSFEQFEKSMLRNKVKDYPHKIKEGDGEGLLSFLDEHFVSSGGLPAIIDDGIQSYILLPHTRERWYTLVDPHVKRKYSVRSIRPEELMTKTGWMIYVPNG